MMTEMRTSLRANLLLLAVAVIWGLSFVAQKAGLEHIGPLLFNAARTTLGALSLLPLLLWRRQPAKDPAGNYLWRGAMLGVVLFAGLTLMQIGIVSTTAGKAGFITGLYVVFVPLFSLLLGQRAGVYVWLGVICAVAGMFLLSVKEGFYPGPGDSLVLGSAVFWAMHMMLMDRFVRDADPVRLSLTQFVVAALLCNSVALLFESFDPYGLLQAWLPVTYAGVVSIGVALTVQAHAQREARPAHVALILCLEGVVAAVAGWAILGEVLTGRMLFGCALIIAGMLTAQWRSFTRTRTAYR